MEIIKTTLSIGADKPFSFLHVSDIHMAETDGGDSERRREFAAKRRSHFAFSPEAVSFVRSYVKKTGYPLINTGDMLDFITPENLRLAREFASETDMMMSAGNHEYWRCHNDRFHYDDVPETYEKKDEALELVSKSIGIEIRFSRREINGVNLVCIDDSDYCIDAEIFEKLKRVEAEGKPIILFMHIPMYSEHLGKGAKFSLCAPPEYFEGCHPTDVWERTPDGLTVEICDYIRKSPLIKCVISGHIHYNVEIIDKDSQNQVVTGLNTIREITVK